MKNTEKMNGFTMAEVLLALLIGTVLSGICLLQAAVLHSATAVRPDDQEQFAILQLREILSLACSTALEEQKLTLEENGRQESLEFDKGRLVKKPGYEIFMEDLETLHFENKNGDIYLTYVRHGKTRTFQLG